MRSLKFRVWDGDCQRFEYFEIGENDDCYGMFRVAANKFGSTVEQHTGLKDKNGKEIYEGDILQIDDHIVGDFEVVWHKLGWKIKRAIGYESLSVHKSEDCTVIGNIHENPELLEAKNE